jgi:hypothetical protein
MAWVDAANRVITAITSASGHRRADVALLGGGVIFHARIRLRRF